MADQLTDAEVRVLGSLVEKQLTTPEYYPLTLNALTAACNQKSNRDPVTSYDETAIVTAVDSLRDKNLVYLFYGSSSRTVKYKHMLPGAFDLSPQQVACLAVLMLRGPQTIGEIRERTGRLHEFSGMGEVQETLDSLIDRSDPLVTRLERQPGQKEARYAHLLAGPVSAGAAAVSVAPGHEAPPASGDRLVELERRVAELEAELASFREKFDVFRRQFE